MRKLLKPTPEQIRTLRLDSGLDEYAFAAYFGLKSGQTIKRWETGKTKPRGAAVALLHLAIKHGLDFIKV